MVHQDTVGHRTSRWSASVGDAYALRPDGIADPRVAITRRGLARIAHVAAEAGARFEREGGVDDAMDWMTAPRALFGGLSAIDACDDLAHCLRGALLHRLDADAGGDASLVDDLMGRSVGDDPARSSERSRGKPMLYTCDASHEGSGCMVWSFVALVATSEDDVRASLAARYGRAVAGAATVRAGFERGGRLAAAMLSGMLADTLDAAAADPTSAIVDGLDLVVEQRFRS